MIIDRNHGSWSQRVNASLIESLEPNQTVRIGFLPFQPDVSECALDYWWPDVPANFSTFSNCSSPGISVELTEQICLILKLNCLLILANHTDWGKEVEVEVGNDGSGSGSGSSRKRTTIWTGMVGDLLNDTYDVTMPDMSPDPNRLKVIEFSYPVVQYGNYWVYRFPNNSISLTAIWGFNSNVWLLLFATLFGICFIIATVENSFELDLGLLRGFRSLFDGTVILFQRSFMSPNRSYGAQEELQQRLGPQPGQTWGQSRISQRLLTIWGLGTLVFVACHSSTILATMLSPDSLAKPFTNTVESLAACVASFRCKMIYYSDTHSAYLQDSGSNGNEYDEATKPLTDALKLNRPIFQNQVETIGMTLTNHPTPGRPLGGGGAGVTYVATMNEKRLALLLRDTRKRCVFYFEKFSGSTNSFAFRRNSSFLPAFNRAIQTLREMGIMEKIVSRHVWTFLDSERMCLRMNGRTRAAGSDRTGITLDSYSGLLLPIGAGIGLACFALAVEIRLRQMEAGRRSGRGKPDVVRQQVDRIFRADFTMI